MGEKCILIMSDLSVDVRTDDLAEYFKHKNKEIQKFKKDDKYYAEITFSSSIIATGMYRRCKNKTLKGKLYPLEIKSNVLLDALIGRQIGDYIMHVMMVTWIL